MPTNTTTDAAAFLNKVYDILVVVGEPLALPSLADQAVVQVVDGPLIVIVHVGVRDTGESRTRR